MDPIPVCPQDCAGACIDGRCHTVFVSAIGAYMAVDRTNLYWTDFDSLKKVPLAGGEPTTLATNLGALARVLVDERYVYVGYVDGPSDSAGRHQPSAVMRVPIEGGTPVTLVSGGSTNAIAIDRDYLYWTDQHAGFVSKVLLAGGDAVELASGQDSPRAITVDDVNVYWANRGGIIMKAPREGGVPARVAVVSDDLMVDIVVDPTDIYALSGGDTGGSLFAIPIEGGTPETLARGQYYPFHMTTDGTALYWINQGNFGGGGVLKFGKRGRLETLSEAPGGGIAVDDTSVYYSSARSGATEKITPK